MLCFCRPSTTGFESVPTLESALAWYRQVIKETTSMIIPNHASVSTKPDTAGTKRRLSLNTSSAHKKPHHTAQRRRSAPKTPGTAGSSTGGRLPKADHVPVIAPSGMNIIREMRLQAAVTGSIASLENSEMLALAKAFQVYCHCICVTPMFCDCMRMAVTNF